MIRLFASVLVLMLPAMVAADVVVPTRTIRANATISDSDVTLKSISNPDAFSNVADVVGQEARTTLYAVRAILFDDVGPPALVARNQIVLLTYQAHGLTIKTEGRSLQRGGIGDRVRVMNLDSRTTLFGLVLEDGSIRVKD